MRRSVRRARALAPVLVVGLVGGLVAAPAGAQPDSDEVETRLQTAEERLQELQMTAATAVEDYNEASVALEEVTSELATTQEERDRLTAEVETLTDAAGDHARRLHKLGPTLELASVFVAGDSTQVGARTAALGRILDGQRADLERLDAARASLAGAEERLAEQHEEASARRARLAETREQVEATLAEQEAEIEQLQQELREAEDREAAEAEAREEAARRRAAERQAEQEEAAEQQAEQQAAEQQAAGERPSTSADEGTTSANGDDDGSQEPSPSARQSAQVAVDTALDQVGKPYQYGADGPDSYDCSGLTSYAWRAAGVDITRTSRSQWHATTRVGRGELQPGDLVFFSRDGTPSGIGHVAMYIGDGDVVEASRSGVPVRTNGDALSRSDILGYGRP